jgi:DNA-binding response OmpR family regulator
MKPTLLVIDDELLLRDVLLDYLTRQGYLVLQASNGHKAIEIARQNKIHLALVDIKMEGMSGLDVTVELKKLDPSMIVVIMTGYPSINTAITALKSGAAEYIVKPFRLDELTRIIKKNLETLETEFENMQLKQRIRELEEQISPVAAPDTPPPIPETASRPLDTPRPDPSPEVHAAISEKYRQHTRSAQEKEIQEKLERLEQLFADGVIEKEEYDRKKAELVDQRHV